MKNISVNMFRDDVLEFPEPPMPDGYSTRMYRPGDGETWVKVQAAAEPYHEMTMAAFQREFGRDLKSLEERQFYLVSPDGEDIGTITAWNAGANWGPRWGLIHWVAIVPDHQGKGLAKPMMAVAMNRLREIYPAACLNTSSGRIGAIKVYLDFGFKPNTEIDQAAEGWAEVKEQLQHPLLEGI